jgi:hypothetical protein
VTDIVVEQWAERPYDIGVDWRNAKAAALGLVVVEPAASELFLDLDTGLEEFRTLLYDVAATAGLRIHRVDFWPSRKPGHWHAVVALEHEITPVMRIALQAALGSDRKRELLGLMRILLDVAAAPTVFFETPERAETMRQGSPARRHHETTSLLAATRGRSDDEIPF